MATVTLDFVGMCVVMRQASQVSIGLLDDPGHLHLVTYYDAEGRAVVDPLAFHPKELRLTGLVSGQTELRNNGRLPDLNTVPGIGRVLPRDVIIRDHLRCHIILTGGVLEAEAPSDRVAEGPWRFPTGPDSAEFSLTDRLRFVTTSDGDVVALGDIQLGLAREAEVRATIVAIDDDIASRRQPLRHNEALTEFNLFYRCTVSPGPIPVYAGAGVGTGDVRALANPFNPICPDILISWD
jgi:hypothetical protein